VSHHLRRLAADDLVERERDGEAVVTTLATEVRETLTARN
jgi:DNA-binding transcriptional ArsR family regulator